MVIGSGTAIRVPPILSTPKRTATPVRPSGQDSVELNREPIQPLGVGNLSTTGLMGQVMKWTSRELPSSQTPMSEEEKQQILDKIEPGDVILTYASHRPNLGHLEYWATGSHYTHCALYEGYGRIIETLGDEVMRSPLVERLEGPVKVAVVRPPYKSFRDRGLVIRAAKDLIGTPYDYKFDNKDPSELYCSEFIEVAMKKVDPELDVPDVDLFGHEVTAPDAFEDMKGAQLVHDGRSNYWTNQRHQWPLYLGAAVGAGVGALLGGPLGAAIGSAVGFEGSVALEKFLK
jgi:uncharacterized protein YycO